MSQHGGGTPAHAFMIAHSCHAGQIDRDGEPHIRHVERVVDLLPEDDPDQLSVAWLHDVLEDSDWTPERLSDAGFGPGVVAAVVTLTRQQGEPYESYVERVLASTGLAGDRARRVKEADLIDNLSRCLRTDDPAATRYRRALHDLFAATVDEAQP